MRKFSKREQELIRSLVDYYPKDNGYKLTVIGDFLSQYLMEKTDIKIAIRTDGNYILYGKEIGKDLYLAFEIFNLFRDLISLHLINIMPGSLNTTSFLGVCILTRNFGHDCHVKVNT